MRTIFRNRNFLAVDLIGWLALPALALALRLDGWEGVADYRAQLALFAGLAVACKFLSLWSFGLYRRYWFYASVDELILIALAVIAAGLAGGVTYFGIAHLVAPSSTPLPRSVPIIDTLLTLIFVGASRLVPRAVGLVRQRIGGEKPGEPALIAGAGGAGTMIAKELRSNRDLGLQPVGFIDDDPTKVQRTVVGLPILGDRDDIPRIAERLRVKHVIIAMPRAPGSVIREIRDICSRAGLTTKTIPGMHDLISGRVRVTQLRDVQIQDLLRREPVQTDQARVAELVAGKSVLVTGAGGSIGSEICRQIARLGARRLILLGHGENSVFDVHNELLALRCEVDVVPVIGDIRHEQRMLDLFSEQQPEIVFHAAAHKHVPMMEMNPEEAVTNNVGGTLNVLTAAQAVGVERFVFISTDKAVNPANIMGATKLLSEMLVHDVSVRTGLPYVSVRFGNVLASRGSVIPLFQRQIAAGGPVTVTDPDMMRYFMTIPEAVQLVLQAATLGTGGETFVLDMGEPVRIVDLAKDLITLSGFEVDKDIEIVFTGLRPGEKLFEELFTGDESHRRTVHHKIVVGRNGDGLNFADPDQPKALVRAAAEGRCLDMERLVSELLPQYLVDANIERGFRQWQVRRYSDRRSRAVAATVD